MKYSFACIDSRITIFGELHGATNVNVYGAVIVEAHGKLEGALSNHGTVIVRDIFDGTRFEDGELRLEKPAVSNSQLSKAE